jgi:hypothetical protein
MPDTRHKFQQKAIGEGSRAYHIPGDLFNFRFSPEALNLTTERRLFRHYRCLPTEEIDMRQARFEVNFDRGYSRLDLALIYPVPGDGNNGKLRNG